MKRKIYIIVSVCLLFLGVVAGIVVAEVKWEFLDVKVDGERQIGLFDVFFVDKNNGWIVGSAFGDERLILHTSDGGRTWQRQSKKSKWTQFLYANRGVHFVDAQNGWIVGDKGIIFHTSTGGLVWLKQESGLEQVKIAGIPYPIDLNKVYFTDKDNGWAVGDLGTIIHTENGGLTWEKQSSGTTEILWGIHCVDRNNCCAVGSRGTILHTSNGGRKWLGAFGGWKQQESGTGATLNGVYFVDRNNGWVVGNGGISHTSDGGKTWQTQTRFNKTDLYKVFFIDKNRGWAVGSDFMAHTGTIKYTVDGGKTWLSQSSGTHGLTSLHFVDENHGWIIGPGAILHYVGDDGKGK